MPRIVMRPDNLNQRNGEFVQDRLKKPLFLNSAPKSGTHLLRNILRMFVPVTQQYHATFIQVALLREHMEAFNPNLPKLSWGHLIFDDFSAAATQPVRHILLVRDPNDWVLARAFLRVGEF